MVRSRFVRVPVLLLLVLLAAAPAWAGVRSAPAETAGAGFAALWNRLPAVWSLVQSVWEKTGGSIDPIGEPQPQEDTSTDNGGSIDPIGG
jgi:hypothetical protein